VLSYFNDIYLRLDFQDVFDKISIVRKVIVAIGGGEIGGPKIPADGVARRHPVETTAIDKEIIRLSGKENPKLLFLGTASGDAEGYIETVREHFGGRLGCRVSALKLASESPGAEQIKDAVFGADIVYVGGGNTANMLKIWRAAGVDVLLREAWKKGAVMSGLSAGANCWFKRCLTDSAAISGGAEKGTMLEVMDCLGFLDGIFVPHILREPARRSETEKIMQGGKYAGETFYLSDDRSALIALDDKIFGISADDISATRAATYDKIFNYQLLSAQG
jgi:dipeptidase E